MVRIKCLIFIEHLQWSMSCSEHSRRGITSLSIRLMRNWFLKLFKNTKYDSTVKHQSYWKWCSPSWLPDMEGKMWASIADLYLFPRVVLEGFYPQQQVQKSILVALNCAGNQKGTQLLPTSKQVPFVVKRWSTNKIQKGDVGQEQAKGCCSLLQNVCHGFSRQLSHLVLER